MSYFNAAYSDKKKKKSEGITGNQENKLFFSSIDIILFDSEIPTLFFSFYFTSDR